MIGVEVASRAVATIRPQQAKIPPGANGPAKSMMRVAIAILLLSTGIHPTQADADLPLEDLPVVRVAPTPSPTVQTSPMPTPAVRRNHSHIKPTTLSWKPLHEHQPAQITLEAPPTAFPTVVAPPAPTRSPTLPTPPTDSDSTSFDDADVIIPHQSTHDYPVQRLEAVNVKMTLEGIILPLSRDAQLAFETITRETIVGSIQQILGSHQIYDLQVQVSLVDASQQDDSLQFNVLITIQSVIQIHDLNRYILSAFNDSMESFIFIHTLKATGDKAFSNIDNITITAGTIVEDSMTSDSTTSHKASAYFIVAIITVVIAVTAGGGLVVCLVQYIRVERRRQQRKKRKHNDTIQSSFDLDDSMNNYISSEIEIACCEMEMSSLGDPSLLSSVSGLVLLEVEDLPVDDYDREYINGICAGDLNGIEVNEDDDDKSVLDATVHSEPLPTQSHVDDGIWRDTSSVPPLPTKRVDARLVDYIMEKIVGIYSIPTATNDTEATPEREESSISSAENESTPSIIESHDKGSTSQAQCIVEDEPTSRTEYET